MKTKTAWNIYSEVLKSYPKEVVLMLYVTNPTHPTLGAYEKKQVELDTQGDNVYATIKDLVARYEILTYEVFYKP